MKNRRSDYSHYAPVCWQKHHVSSPLSPNAEFVGATADTGAMQNEIATKIMLQIVHLSLKFQQTYPCLFKSPPDTSKHTAHVYV